MEKRLKFLPLSLIICAAILMVGALFSRQQEAKEQYVYEPKPGKVTFSHAKHLERVNNDCKICHHEAKEDNPAEACSDCHKKILNSTALGEAMPLSKAFHTRCITCHQQMVKEEKKAPVACKECHVKLEGEVIPE